MTERSYAIRYRVQRELCLHRGGIWSAKESAERNLAAINANVAREACIVIVDHADLQPVAADEYQHAEARMLYWTTRCQQLRPGGPLPSVEWQQLTSTDVAEFGRVAQGWRAPRSWLDGGAVIDGPSPTLRSDVALWRVLRRVLEKLGEEPR